MDYLAYCYFDQRKYNQQSKFKDCSTYFRSVNIRLLLFCFLYFSHAFAGNPPIHYSLVRNSDSLSKYIYKNFHGDSLKVLMALNRVDATHFHRPDSIIFPDRYDSLSVYSPFPDSLHLDTVKKRIVVSYRLQAFAFYEHGKQILWGPVSMGKSSTPTPTGMFFTNWKAKTTVSTENPEWILNWYFNLENFRGVSLHEYDLPGYPASHACIRMLAEDAKFIYYHADQWKLTPEGTIEQNGTPVLIFGKYPFGKRRPWRNVVNDPSRAIITEKELLKELH